VNKNKKKVALALRKDPAKSIKGICKIVDTSRNTYYKYTRSEDKSAAESKEKPLAPTPTVMKIKK
jgi:ACT domain-containing protein